jgi:hypothetical protein
MSIDPQSAAEGTFAPDNLLADAPVTHWLEDVTIVSGAGVLVRGTLLGRITSGGKYQTSLSGAGDGSQTPVAILAKDVDATEADVVAPVYVAGGFNERAVTFGTAHTADSVRAALRALGIYLSPTVSA